MLRTTNYLTLHLLATVLPNQHEEETDLRENRRETASASNLWVLLSVKADVYRSKSFGSESLNLKLNYFKSHCSRVIIHNAFHVRKYIGCCTVLKKKFLDQKKMQCLFYLTKCETWENEGQLKPSCCCLILQNLLLPCFASVEHYLLTQGQMQCLTDASTRCTSPFSPSAAAPKQMPHKYVVWKLVYSDTAYPAAMTWWGRRLSFHLTDFEGRVWKQGR